MRVGDFDFDNILLDEISYEDSFMTFHTKFLWVQNHCVLDEFIKIYDGITYLVLFGIE